MENFEFLIKEYKGIYKKIFKFFPENTHVHSFNNNPPKSWKEVYKVYYSWGIILKFDSEDNEEEVLLKFDCDECSMIPNLSDIIKYVIKTGKTFNTPTIGQPAADWIIEKSFMACNSKSGKCECYNFQIFNNFTGQGFRFSLNKKETLEFCDFLDYINQYALEHGEGI